MKRTDEQSTYALAITATSTRRKRAPLRLLLTSASIALAFAATPVGAVEEHHPEAKAGSMPPVSATASPEVGRIIEKMQENVRQMQSQLERAAMSKTDEERRAALADHMRTMHANMMLGRSMIMAAADGHPAMEGATMAPGTMGGGTMGPGTMGAGMMSGMMCSGMMGRGTSGSPDAAELQRLERRIDMMQMMMEQIMRSRAGQPGAASPMPAQ